jgi:hypothetical protein
MERDDFFLLFYIPTNIRSEFVHFHEKYENILYTSDSFSLIS